MGRLWHRWSIRRLQGPRFPGEKVTYENVRRRLGVNFRGFGGGGAVSIAATGREPSAHRPGWRERLGSFGDRIPHAYRQGDRVRLSEAVDLFPDRQLNRDLYLWLAAYFAMASSVPAPACAFRRDVAFLRQAWSTSAEVCARLPGLRPVYADLCRQLLVRRPRRRLPLREAEIERGIIESLRAGASGEHDLRGWTQDEFLSARSNPSAAARGYRTFLPVAIWGDILPGSAGATTTPGDAERRVRPEDVDGDRRRDGKRRRYDQADRRDPIVIDRFERIFSWAEMLDVNRPTNDDDGESARKAVDDLDEISVGKVSRKLSTALRFNLDLAPRDGDRMSAVAPIGFPEWDFRLGGYRDNHCAVYADAAPLEGEEWQPGPATIRTMRKVRRQFEALRQRRGALPRQVDGFEFDTDALVGSHSDFAATGWGSDRIYRSMTGPIRDLSVAVLIDVSLSTDSWVENRRVLDVEKESITVLLHGLAASGDEHAVYAFSSRNRGYVRVDRVKEFAEFTNTMALRRVAALKPGYYTRIGAALRYVTDRLAERDSRHRLLLVVTDGKPNDIDGYEGRYGVEDTRKAIQECRRRGIAPYAITIDRKSRDYLKFAFGSAGYSVISKATRLPVVLPAIYRNLIG